MTVPLISIVIPTYNEAEDLTGALEAIAAQDHPGDHLEVIVVDGGSADGTADVARRALTDLGLERGIVLTNERRTTSSNLNMALDRATGEVVCRVDARTRIQPHYARRCAEVLSQRSEVSVVGGAQIAVPRDETPRAIGIARALNNALSMGGSRYRRTTTSGPSDTVYLGAFRRHELLSVGGWDEDLVSNQDFDLCQRMAARGTVWFDASLRSSYLPRSTLGQLWRQYLRFGRAKVRYWRHTGVAPQRRQWALLVLPPTVTAIAVVALVAASPPMRFSLAASAIAASFIVEDRGSSGPPSGAAGRVVSVAAMAAVALGWWFGVALEGIRPTRERVGSDLRAPAS